MRNNLIAGSILFAMLLAVAPTPSISAEKLVFNTGTREPFTTENGQGFLNLLTAEVFRRLGMEAEVIVYKASARALQNADQGVDDGVVLRIKGLEKKYPNLVRVPEKIMDNDFVAYSIGKTVATEDWHSLDNHSIAYILGWQIFQNNLGHHKNTDKIKDVSQLFSLLKQDRVDFVLFERWQGLWHADRLGLAATVHEPPLAQREMFMYLHKKHAHLVDKAAATLKAMKEDGAYQKIVDQVLTPLSK